MCAGRKTHWWTDINGNELKINLNQFPNHPLRHSHQQRRVRDGNNEALKWQFCTLAAAQIEQ
jgi:hypothetical protein